MHCFSLTIDQSVQSVLLLLFRFIEYGEYNGNYYGTSLDSIRSILSRNKVCLLDVQPQVGEACSDFVSLLSLSSPETSLILGAITDHFPHSGFPLFCCCLACLGGYDQTLYNCIFKQIKVSNEHTCLLHVMSSDI